jgi:hypothetical protein
MLKGAELIGAVTIYRDEVRDFTDKQIGLVPHELGRLTAWAKQAEK